MVYLRLNSEWLIVHWVISTFSSLCTLHLVTLKGGVIMPNLESIITSVVSLIGAIVLAYKAYTNHGNDIIKDFQNEIKRKDEDIELYRQKWLKAEQKCDELTVEISKLRKELNNDD